MTGGRLDRALRGVQSQLIEGPWFWAATAVLAVVLAAPIFIHYPMNHDIGAHVDLAGRVLDGEKLYTDILEPNPPLIVYLYAGSVALARVAGAPPHVVIHIVLIALNLLCALVAHRAMEKADTPASRVERRVLLWSLLYLFLSYPGYDFGQRDPLALAAALPYVVCAAGRAKDRLIPTPFALLTGALAAFGFALKPFFGLLWLAVEAYLFFARRKRGALLRPESLVVMGLVGAYGLWVLLGTDYLANLKLVLFSYENYQSSTALLLAVSRPRLWATALVLVGLFRAPEGDRDFRTLLALTVLAFLYSGFAQSKGWEYHFVPVRMAAVLAMVAVALGTTRAPEALRGLVRVPEAVPVGLACLFLFMGVTSLHAAARWPDRPGAALVRTLAALQREHAAGKKVLWVTSMADPAYPSINYAGVSSAQTLGTFPLARLYAGVSGAPGGAFPYHAPAEMSATERLLLDRMAADLETRPELVIFDRRRLRLGFGETGFEYEAYLFRDERIRSFVMANYRPLVEVADFRLYKLASR